MVIHWSTPYSEDADEAVEQGEFERAATLRAQSAQSRLERFGIESNASADLAVGDLLYAIYYARRAGADERAIHLRTLLESYAKLLQHAAYRWLQEHWPGTTGSCLVGLFEEWIGDAHLFTESAAAVRYYDRAEPWYQVEAQRATDQVSQVMPCWGWGAEPQFEMPLFAFQSFLDWKGLEEADRMSTAECADQFVDRLEYKLRLVREFCEKSGAN
jgi:hypothetical protein